MGITSALTVNDLVLHNRYDQFLSAIRLDLESYPVSIERSCCC